MRHTRTVGSLTYEYDPDFHDPEIEDQLEQSRRNHRLPDYHAGVQWWDATSIYVLCPICHDIHRHGFSSPSYPQGQRRVSHCGGLGVYVLLFPFNAETGKAWYSVNKERALFVAVGADPGPYFARSKQDELLDGFRDQLQGKRSWGDAEETRHIPEDNPQIQVGYDINMFKEALAAAITGRVRHLREYLETSPEADIFLRGVDYNKERRGSGRTTLHLAACEQHPGTVALLLNKRADPNAQDATGRTPLMEAALWGRLDNVRLLLDSRADRNLVSVRHGRRVKAVDFARNSRDNEAERNENMAYQEGLLKRSRDHEAIVHLLEDASGWPDRDEPELWSVNFIGDGGYDNQVTMVAHFDRPSPWKTVGIMYREGRFAPVSSMSGWGHEGLHTRISGKDWTDDVLKLCQAVGFRLTRDDDKDHGTPGRFYACHTEKQLIAYFVKHHVFLDSDFGERPETPELPAVCTVEELMEKLSIARESGRAWDEMEPLRELRDIEPPVSLRKAYITVCRPVCSDCERFVTRVNEFLGLELVVRCSPQFNR